jgi:4-amino-4-deoxychorismate lyase
MTYISLNGSLTYSLKEMNHFDRLGVFTTLLIKDAHVFFLNQHRKRLENHARQFGILPPEHLLSENELFQLMRMNKAKKGIYRLKAILTEMEYYLTLENYVPSSESDVRAIIYSFDEKYQPCLKTIENAKKRQQIFMYAKSKGASEALCLNQKGILLEGIFTNLFWIENKILYTPDFGLPILQGVTIQAVIKIAKKLGFEIVFVRYTPEKISKSSQLFRCNALKGIEPIQQVDQQMFLRDLDLEQLLLKEYNRYSIENAVYIG